MKLETEVSLKTQLQLPIIIMGAAKDNEMKIFEIITLIFITDSPARTFTVLLIKI